MENYMNTLVIFIAPLEESSKVQKSVNIYVENLTGQSQTLENYTTLAITILKNDYRI